MNKIPKMISDRISKNSSGSKELNEAEQVYNISLKTSAFKEKRSKAKKLKEKEHPVV